MHQLENLALVVDLQMGRNSGIMARKARVEFEGAVYHVLDRGDRRKAVFKDDADGCAMARLSRQP